jgi:hypothetical protein
MSMPSSRAVHSPTPIESCEDPLLNNALVARIIEHPYCIYPSKPVPMMLNLHRDIHRPKHGSPPLESLCQMPRALSPLA